MQSMNRDDVAYKVNDFYEKMPFNFRASSECNADLIRRRNQIEIYADLHKVLALSSGRDEILDVGCGVGWFTNTAGLYYRPKALGIDMCEKALERASDIAGALGISDRVKFIKCDLFHPCFGRKFLFVNSLGVLHHTYDIKEAITAVSGLVEEKGYLHLGLYHKYGREPFLEIFAKYRQKILDGKRLDAGETKEAFGIFKGLNANVSDELFLESWFRDQVLHPHESQHTLKEIYQILSSLGFDLLSTSINNFGHFSDVAEIFEKEKAYREVSIEKNIKKKVYFPGFFTVLARRR